MGELWPTVHIIEPSSAHCWLRAVQMEMSTNPPAAELQESNAVYMGNL